MTGLIDFSTDASSNDTAAPPILWQEGQPANTVNNSNRAMMAALACWRDDNIGVIVASRGSGDIYALTTSQTITAGTSSSPGTATRGHTLAFFVDAANQGPAALAPDGCPAKPLRRNGNIELAPGDLVPGTSYRVAYLPGLGCYIIQSNGIERPGRVSAFAADAAVPPGWVVCDGRPLSRAVYSALLAAIGTGYGTPDANTFNIPDYRGRSLFGADNGAGRLTGAGGLTGGIAATGGSETVVLTVDQLANHSHGGSTAGAGAHDHGGSVSAAGQHAHGGATIGAGGHAHTGTTSGAGGHSHTGSTDPAEHNHQYTTASIKNATAGPGNSATGLWAGNDTPAPDSITAISNSFTTSGVGDHAHGFTTNGVADHAHGIQADGAHSHGIAGVGDHAHGLSISAAGSGAAHPNMPPAAVIIWAIKA